MRAQLKKLMAGENITESEAGAIAEALASGTVEPAVAGATLTALAIKGESVEEIVGFAKALRTKMQIVPAPEGAIDTCGTGGDGGNTLNASTMAAVVCAAAGVPVAKHGNRAVSSKCGSFDLLENLGVNFNLTAPEAGECLAKTNLAFLFAPNFHPAFKNIMPVRKALGIRTIFNFLGPLLNPAGVTRQVIGVSAPGLPKKIGEALMRLGSSRVLIVYSADGLDEVSIAAPTKVFEFKQGAPAAQFTIAPEKFFPSESVAGGGVQHNAARARAIFSGAGSEPENEFVALNAALGLYIGGAVDSVSGGVALAKEILRSGQALLKLNEVIVVARSFKK